MRLGASSILVVSIVGLVIAFPILRPPIYFTHLLIVIFLYASLAISWHMLSGYTGYVSFGHAAYFGIGAYLTGLVFLAYEPPMPIAILIGGAAAGLVGLALGLSCMRLRGYYFSIASLMLVFIGYVVFVNITDIIPGARMEIWLPTLPLDIFSYTALYYYIFLGFLAMNVAVSIWIERSKFGYGLRSIKEDEDVAEMLGVETTRLKAIASAISAFSAGIAGALYLQYLSYADVGIYFNILLSFDVIFMSFVGGMGTWIGPLIASVILIPISEGLTIVTRGEVGRILYGVLFIVAILLMPEGLYGLYKTRTRPRERASSGR